MYREKIITLIGEVNKEIYDRLLQETLPLLKEGCMDDIIIILNSPGGSVRYGFAIYDWLTCLPNKIIMIVNGMCNSIAAIIYLAASYENRYMTQNSGYFVHASACDAKDSFDTVKLESFLEESKEIDKRIKDIIRGNTQIPQEILEQAMSGVMGIRFSLDECLRFGISTGVISSFTEILHQSEE